MRFSRVLAAIVAVLVVAPVQAQARSLAIGFYEPGFTTPDGPGLVDAAKGVGAGIIRITPLWSNVAPATRPAGFSPAAPDSPGYNWTRVDAAVRQAARDGLQILFTFENAPSWAESPGRSASAPPGTWEPDLQQLRDFATAAATRYSGQFPDPLGGTLPRIGHWQAWNEPNLATYLTPQWVRKGRGWRATSPGYYRAMLNTVYGAVKAVSPTNFVVSAGTAPYGDLVPGGRRIAPVDFMHGVLCLDVRLHRQRGCGSPARLDAISHHPYAVAGPGRHALNAGDAAIPDIGKLTRLLRAAERVGTVQPKGKKRVWVTEISWDSRPPDPDGVPERTHANWLAESFQSLWRQGVDTITWFQVVDQPPVPDYGSTYQSGVLFADRRPKLAATAFEFPFVARSKGRRVSYWLRSPAAGPLAIEFRIRGQWRAVRRVNAKAGQVLSGNLPRTGDGLARATAGGLQTLTWRL